MAADLAAVRDLCEVDDLAARLLASPRRPIVLLPRSTTGGPSRAAWQRGPWARTRPISPPPWPRGTGS